MKTVLGLKVGPGHDTGAAIVYERNGEVRVSAISEERLDRVKHSRAFPQRAIDFCLNEASCRMSDVSLVVTDFLFSSSARDAFPTSIRPKSKTWSWSKIPSAVPASDEPAPEVQQKIAFFKSLESMGIPVLFAEHHLCHAASAYFATDWEDAACLVVDGHGSYYETQSIFSCEANAVTKLATTHQPGVGWMYSAVTEVLLGFAHLQEGKTMGLAGWTADPGPFRSRFTSKLRTGAPLDTACPDFCEIDPANSTWRLVAPEDLRRRRQEEDPTAVPFVQYACAAQAAMEDDVMRLATYARKLCPRKRLCYAGGIALNILANRKLLDSGLFEDIFIQPAASDPGIPLGAALLGYYSVLGGTQRWKMSQAFLAREYTTDDITASIATWNGWNTTYRVQDLAKILANNYLAAWFEGASEFGPRALGHRSILCAPCHPQMKEFLNREVKHREMFRPFAPIIPTERQAEYFDLTRASPYMLLNARVHAEFANRIPAVVHADGTARVQSIDSRDQPKLHGLLEAIGAITGIPILLNTSLNLAGEPIVESPSDAIDLFSRARLDVLVIGNHILSKLPFEQLLLHPNPGLASMTV